MLQTQWRDSCHFLTSSLFLSGVRRSLRSEHMRVWFAHYFRARVGRWSFLNLGCSDIHVSRGLDRALIPVICFLFHHNPAYDVEGYSFPLVTWVTVYPRASLRTPFLINSVNFVVNEVFTAFIPSRTPLFSLTHPHAPPFPINYINFLVYQVFTECIHILTRPPFPIHSPLRTPNPYSRSQLCLSSFHWKN